MAGTVKQRATKRPIYVNNVHCESMAEAARQASKLLKRDVQLWEVQYAVNENKLLKGLKVVDAEYRPKTINKKSCVDCFHCKQSSSHVNFAYCAQKKKKQIEELEYWQTKDICKDYEE